MAICALDIIFFILKANSLSQISHCVTFHMEAVSISAIHVQRIFSLSVQTFTNARWKQTDAAVTSKHRVAY